MSDSPFQVALHAIDQLDLDSLISGFAPTARLTTVFGEAVEGREAVRVVLGAFFAGLRATEHVVSNKWNPGPDVWIAEMSATYELTDFSRRGPYRRAMFMRAGDDGIEELHIYGAHELQLLADGGAYQEVRGPHGWLPTL
jgi:hypothetical protein